MSPEEIALLLRKITSHPDSMEVTGPDQYMPEPEETPAEPASAPEPMSPGAAISKLVSGGVGHDVDYLSQPDNLRDLGTSMALGPIFGKLGALPKIASSLLGAYTFLNPMEAGSGELVPNPKTPDQVKDWQVKLKQEGLYTGPIDGKWETGTTTAKGAFEKRESEREATGAQKAAADAAAKAAEAATAETKRKGEADVAANKHKEEGQALLQKTEDEVGPFSRLLREYGGSVGYGAGLISGGVTRKGVTKLYDLASKGRAGAADAILSKPAKDTAAKVAKVNQFWAQGQKGGSEAPFVANPKAKAGFVTNPEAPPASDLYQPSRARNVATDLGVAGAYGAESGYGQFSMEPDARKEVREAEEAVNTDPSLVNIQRLEAAKNRVGTAEFVKNMGRTGAGSYLASGLKYQRNPSRPDVAKAEAEQLRLNDKLAPTPKAKPTAPAPKFVPGVPAPPKSGMSAKELSDGLADPANQWLKANPNKTLSRRHVLDMAKEAGVEISPAQASTVASRLQKAYGEKYINSGAKSALGQKYGKYSDDVPLDANGIPVKPPKDPDPNGPGNF